MIPHLLLILILLKFALPMLTSGPRDGNELSIAAFDLPVLSPASYIDAMRSKTQSLCDGKMNVDSAGDKIPHHLWIAVKDNSSSYLNWENIQREIALNPTWSVHICDNEAKDSFIETFFPNTSLLSSYNNINPVIAGASKADIWRYAMLYVFGGVYIDSDSELRKPLNEVIKPGDQMILACENNYFDGDWCYSPNSEFATFKVVKKNPKVEKMGIFKGRVLTNWCMMSAPNHTFLSAALNTFVKLSKLEYTRLSGLKVSMWDPFSKYVYCTTGPTMFTVSARMVVIANSMRGNGTGSHDHKLIRRPHNNADSPSAGSSDVTIDSYKLASKDFGHEGGVFKAIRLTKNDKDHYTNIVPQKVRGLLVDISITTRSSSLLIACCDPYCG